MNSDNPDIGELIAQAEEVKAMVLETGRDLLVAQADAVIADLESKK